MFSKNVDKKSRRPYPDFNQLRNRGNYYVIKFGTKNDRA